MAPENKDDEVRLNDIHKQKEKISGINPMYQQDSMSLFEMFMNSLSNLYKKFSKWIFGNATNNYTSDITPSTTLSDELEFEPNNPKGELLEKYLDGKTVQESIKANAEKRDKEQKQEEERIHKIREEQKARDQAIKKETLELMKDKEWKPPLLSERNKGATLEKGLSPKKLQELEKLNEKTEDKLNKNTEEELEFGPNNPKGELLEKYLDGKTVQESIKANAEKRDKEQKQEEERIHKIREEQKARDQAIKKETLELMKDKEWKPPLLSERNKGATLEKGLSPKKLQELEKLNEKTKKASQHLVGGVDHHDSKHKPSHGTSHDNPEEKQIGRKK